MAQAPSTLDGAYMLHQLFHVDWESWHQLKDKKKRRLQLDSAQLLRELTSHEGEDSAYYHLLGHKGDLLFLFTRRDAADLARVERQLTRLPIWPYLEKGYSYFSVVELSLHGSMERYRKLLTDQGLEDGSPEWEQALEGMLAEDREVQKGRLYPTLPQEPYLCFYPMDKRRGEDKNWFLVEPKERGRMMAAHGKIGRKYSGKVWQIISGSMGLDDYDWGVDLFARDPLQFKKLIYEMRFDEVSAIYAEFGSFMIGCRLDPERLLELEPWPGPAQGTATEG